MSQSHTLPLPAARAATPDGARPVWRRALAWLRPPRRPEIGIHELTDRDIRELGSTPDSYRSRAVWAEYDLDRRS